MSATIALYPKVEIVGGPITVALKSLPVCQSVQCADKPPPMTLEWLAFGHDCWTFEWGIEHGVGRCVRCGAWHQLYHYTPATEFWVRCNSAACDYFETARRATIEEARADYEWHADNAHEHRPTNTNQNNRTNDIYAEIIDSRPEHYAGGIVPEEVPA